MIRVIPKNVITPSAPNREGFTLVEMLVSVALVMLMMSLFAQVFQVSSGMISNQKGMAKQDQDVRTMTILLRGDIRQRTFVDVVPFVAGQNTDSSVTSASGPNYAAERRRGFFSISENNPDDSTDDVLHLTIMTDPHDEQEDNPYEKPPRLPFSGRASLMFNGTTPANQSLYLLGHPDQPEFDDGQSAVDGAGNLNNTGSSKFAEVCWFLRNGTLYRRQLLIREPYSRSGNTTEEPADSAGAEFIAFEYTGEEHVDTTTNPNGVFWRGFDYSAYWEPDTSMTGMAYGLKFHGVDTGALDNLSDATGVTNLLGFPRSLGIPFLRFGSSTSRAVVGPPSQIAGPREFLDPTNPSTFIGRFTTEETSHNNFAYPGNSTLATDPFNSSGGPSLTMSNGKVAEYQFSGDVNQRRGDDIVMTNVHSFDIQVWDDVLKEFANLGHSQTRDIGGTAVEGWYHQNQRDDTAGFGNRFDTWHPFVDMPASPPYSAFGTNPQDSRTKVPRSGATNGGLGSDMEIPLRAIRIAIRFYDVGSDQIRDLTFTFPLID